MPDDVRVRCITAEHDPSSVVVFMEGDRFDEVPPDSQAPSVNGLWGVEQVVVDGKVYCRLGWAE